MIFHHDVRIADHHISTLKAHEQEICGLEWSDDGTQLASGGNDNKCCIWDATSENPRHTFIESNAAVRALAWCPWKKNLLATGGGTADGCIRFYNTRTGIMQDTVATESQVCSLVWGRHEKEIVSSHGYSQNQLTVWKYPSLEKIADLVGHTDRVLHTSLSSDGTTICSAAADETLRFWKVWDLPEKTKKNETSPSDDF
jgi:cell division cycle protein 20 (cofactor of APC complex)